eukprot:6293536-Amphidinium_carterae.1
MPCFIVFWEHHNFKAVMGFISLALLVLFSACLPLWPMRLSRLGVCYTWETITGLRTERFETERTACCLAVPA